MKRLSLKGIIIRSLWQQYNVQLHNFKQVFFKEINSLYRNFLASKTYMYIQVLMILFLYVISLKKIFLALSMIL